MARRPVPPRTVRLAFSLPRKIPQPQGIPPGGGGGTAESGRKHSRNHTLQPGTALALDGRMSCHVVQERAAAAPKVLTLRARPLRLALVGQPNVGKSVVFGRLTGRYVTVSNYPGTTVAVSKGRALVGAEVCDVIDTPGVNT